MNQARCPIPGDCDYDAFAGLLAKEDLLPDVEQTSSFMPVVFF